jgi:Holliday junction DNA helicase RuvA
VRPEPGGVWYQVLIPSFATDALRDQIGKPVTMHTIQYFEPQGPGGALVPRLIGFPSIRDRRFFELLTGQVEGIGNRKALRSLVHPPAAIARAIANNDTAWLQKLPEVGRKTAEKIVLELKDKVAPFLVGGDAPGVEPKPAPLPEDDATGAAVRALVALGEMRPDAERMVRKALAKNPRLKTPDAIVQAAYGG